MDTSGGVFASLLLRTDEPTNSRWLRVGRTTIFVIKAFDENDSARITFGLRQPTTFVFTDLGNISCKQPSSDSLWFFKNPLDDNVRTDYTQQSIGSFAAVERQYRFDSSNVISRNLKYILHKKNGVWHLLYNPTHSLEFKRYYEYVMAQATNVQWGASTLTTDAHLNLRSAFKNYCDAFQTTDRRGRKSFLDPTCNIIYSPEQCRQSSLFDDNLVTHDDNKVQHSRRVLDQLGSSAGAGGPPYCMCTGAPYNYVQANVNDDSFIHVFQQMNQCDPELTMNICNIINTANTLNISGSSMSAECGAPLAEEPPAQPAQPTPPRQQRQPALPIPPAQPTPPRQQRQPAPTPPTRVETAPIRWERIAMAAAVVLAGGVLFAYRPRRQPDARRLGTE